MAWTAENQRDYSQQVPRSHAYASKRVPKLLGDIYSSLSTGERILVEEAIAEAFRAGAQAAIQKATGEVFI